MSLSGNLEDVSVADALQFIHLGGRTGTLTLQRDGVQAEIGFHRGRIVSAWAPGSKRLGDLLLESGTISSDALEQALTQQAAETPRRPLGQILVANGALSDDAMYAALQQQIERTIYELVTWTSGTFEFALDDLTPIDDVSVLPGDIIGHLRLDTQSVLIDALRVFDERNRMQEGPGVTSFIAPAAPLRPSPQSGGPPPPPGGDEEPRPRLQVVSADEQLAEQLAQTVPSEEATVARITLRDAGDAPPGEAPPVVLVDLREASVAVAAIEQLRRARPRAMIVAVVADSASTSAAFGAGAMAVVPADATVDRKSTRLNSS